MKAKASSPKEAADPRGLSLRVMRRAAPAQPGADKPGRADSGPARSHSGSGSSPLGSPPPVKAGRGEGARPGAIGAARETPRGLKVGPPTVIVSGRFAPLRPKTAPYASQWHRSRPLNGNLVNFLLLRHSLATRKDCHSNPCRGARIDSRYVMDLISNPMTAEWIEVLILDATAS